MGRETARPEEEPAEPAAQPAAPPPPAFLSPAPASAVDWRWQQARYEYQCDRDGVRGYTASTDLGVKLARRFQETWSIPEMQGQPCRELIPAMAYLYDIRSDNSPGCTRFAVEAALLARAAPDFYTKKINRNLLPSVVRMYGLLFFDVEAHLDSPFWVEEHVFTPALQDHGDTRASNLIWKIIGYHGGQERLLLDCLSGKTYSEKEMEWIVKLTVSQHAKDTLHWIHSRAKLPKEVAAHAHEQTLGVWQGATMRLAELSSQADEAGVPQKFASMSRLLKRTDAEKTVDKIEKLDAGVVPYARPEDIGGEP